MQVTIIISYYKALTNLKLILKALNFQSNNSFEVIISEDDQNEETVSFLKNNKSQYNFPIEHIYQKEDAGFRKNVMLNRAIIKAKNDLLVFIDGDCIPNKHFVKEYINNSEKAKILTGRRVMLGKKTSKSLINSFSLDKLNLLSLIFSDTKKVKEAIYFPYFKLFYKQRGLCGCNWGILKEHIMLVNGFDEDYQNPGVGEDTDIEWRLKQSGFKMKSVKNKAIVFHIYHPRIYSASAVKINYDIFQERKKANSIRCSNGIEKAIKQI